MSKLPPSFDRPRVLWAAVAISAAVVVAYLNSFSVPLVFDDGPSIVGNATIRQLWPPWAALSPPAGEGLTVDGRPVLNFSLALNYAVGGTGVVGYHVFNLVIHLGATLTLFGVVRRSLLLLGTFLEKKDATPLAFVTALLWALHPLQTESVTYVIQRAESLMGLFYLFTLYSFIRGTLPAGNARWLAASVISCLLGAATKEVTVSAPLLVLLYDRALVAGTFREAWQRRWRYYLCLAAIWPLLALLVFGTGSRGGTAGFGINVTAWDYSLTQYQAIFHYLRLSFWPSPLIFDYGTQWVKHAVEAVPYAACILCLVAATVWSLVRRPWLGVWGVWFFAILAPTSSILPGNRQTLAEHRMYLPLAAVVVLAVVGSYRVIACGAGTRAAAGRRILILGTACAVGLGWLTIRRNEDYRTELTLYRDTVAKRPDNAFARYNLGKALAESGAPAEAIAHYEAALRLEPTWAHAHYNLGNALAELGRSGLAAEQFRHALRLKPDYLRARYNLGNMLVQLGDRSAALDEYLAVVRLRPDYAEARDNLGSVLLDLGRTAEAVEQYRQVVALGAAAPETHCNLGVALLLLDRARDALPHFEKALAGNPRLVPAREGMARARAALEK